MAPIRPPHAPSRSASSHGPLTVNMNEARRLPDPQITTLAHRPKTKPDINSPSPPPSALPHRQKPPHDNNDTIFVPPISKLNRPHAPALTITPVRIPNHTAIRPEPNDPTFFQLPSKPAKIAKYTSRVTKPNPNPMSRRQRKNQQRKPPASWRTHLTRPQRQRVIEKEAKKEERRRAREEANRLFFARLAEEKRVTKGREGFKERAPLTEENVRGLGDGGASREVDEMGSLWVDVEDGPTGKKSKRARRAQMLNRPWKLDKSGMWV